MLRKRYEVSASLQGDTIRDVPVRSSGAGRRLCDWSFDLRRSFGLTGRIGGRPIAALQEVGDVPIARARHGYVASCPHFQQVGAFGFEGNLKSLGKVRRLLYQSAIHPESFRKECEIGVIWSAIRPGKLRAVSIL